jgi:prepilin-type N-terminal cleavage/methylation domain-containing protein
MKSINRKNGFTLIETLVAITILMISIVGPLTIASKGLTAAVGSRDQVIASYLAQDAMEYLKNVRDTDLLANSASGWSTFLNTYLGTVGCTAGACGVETAPTASQAHNQGTLIGCNVISNCNLYIDSQNSYYTYNSSGGNILTQFNRTFTVTQESSGGLPDAALVTVTVTWKNGTISNQVVLNDVFFNTLR